MTVREQILLTLETVDGVYLIEDHEGQDIANAADGFKQGDGARVECSGGFLEMPLDLGD